VVWGVWQDKAQLILGSMVKTFRERLTAATDAFLRLTDTDLEDERAQGGRLSSRAGLDPRLAALQSFQVSDFASNPTVLLNPCLMLTI